MKKIRFEADLYVHGDFNLITIVDDMLTYGDKHQEHFFGPATIISIKEVEDDDDEG